MKNFSMRSGRQPRKAGYWGAIVSKIALSSYFNDVFVPYREVVIAAVQSFRNSRSSLQGVFIRAFPFWFSFWF